MPVGGGLRCGGRGHDRWLRSSAHWQSLAAAAGTPPRNPRRHRRGTPTVEGTPSAGGTTAAPDDGAAPAGGFAAEIDGSGPWDWTVTSIGKGTKPGNRPRRGRDAVDRVHPRAAGRRGIRQRGERHAGRLLDRDATDRLSPTGRSTSRPVLRAPSWPTTTTTGKTPRSRSRVNLVGTSAASPMVDTMVGTARWRLGADGSLHVLGVDPSAVRRDRGASSTPSRAVTGGSSSRSARDRSPTSGAPISPSTPTACCTRSTSTPRQATSSTRAAKREPGS